MGDYLVRALAYNGQIRAYAVRSTDTVNEAQRRHSTWPTASAALGRAISAAVMMGSMLKGEEKLTVKIEGDGPLGAILVDTNAKGDVRGYVKNPQVHVDLNEDGKLDVRKAVGTSGFLSVVKDMGKGDFFTGQVPLVSGELGEDFTYYFASSEQIPSSVGVGVLVDPNHTIIAAGGFIIQVMPGATEETITEIENRLKILPPISKLIEQGMTPEELLYELLGKDHVKILDTLPVRFKCTCSKERFARALVSLGPDDLKDLIEQQGKAETVCHFCNEKYVFSREELEELRAQAEKEKP